MDEPFLSIITINLNNVDGLKRTIDSVRLQDYQDYEFLVIDGASTDGSLAMIEEQARLFSQRVSEPDSGIFNAMNKGIKLAKGRYLLFLNSGDAFNGQAALSTFIENPEFGGDIVYGDYKFDQGEKVYADHLTPLYFVRTSLPHQSTLFHKKVFEQMGGYDESYRIVADRAFYVRCLLSGDFAFKHIKQALVHFDLKGVSNRPDHKAKKLEEDQKMFKEFYGPFYEDYIQMLALERQLSATRTRTIPGILKRIKRKFWRNG